MLNSLLILLSLACVSCGDLNQLSQTDTDPAFISYIQHYQDVVGKPVDYAVRFTSADQLDPWCVAECIHHNTRSKRQVRVELNFFWGLETDEERQLLLDHEFGHCSADLVHTEALHRADDCPKSIMYPNVLPVIWCSSVLGYFYPEDGSDSYLLPGNYL